MTLLDQLIEAASRGLATVPGKVHFVNVTAKHIARIADSAEREFYVKRVANAVGIPMDTVRRLFTAKAAGE